MTSFDSPVCRHDWPLLHPMPCIECSSGNEKLSPFDPFTEALKRATEKANGADMSFKDVDFSGWEEPEDDHAAGILYFPNDFIIGC